MALILKKNDGNQYFLRRKSTTIGRKDCDIIIENDKSISKTHATILIKDNVVYLVDNNSKYKTFYNGKQLEPDKEVVIEPKVQMRFGKLNTCFTLLEVQIASATSRLSVSNKAKLKKILQNLNGRIENNVSAQCTHLTADELALTEKILFAIIDEVPIVTMNYWNCYEENVAKGLALPKYGKNYRPPLAQPLARRNIEWDYNSKRKTLFKNKIFVFEDDREMNEVAEIIQKIGGSCLCWSTSPLTLEKFSANEKQYIFVQTLKPFRDPALKEIIQKVAKLNQRPIPREDIAMAILLCSTEKECNPFYNRSAAVFLPPPSKQQTKFEVLVSETPQFTQKITKTELGESQDFVIPPSMDDVKPQVSDKKLQVFEVKPKRCTIECDPHLVLNPCKIFKRSTGSDATLKTEVNVASTSTSSEVKSIFTSIKLATSKRSRTVDEELPPPKRPARDNNTTINNESIATPAITLETSKSKSSETSPKEILTLNNECTVTSVLETTKQNPFQRPSVEKRKSNENKIIAMLKTSKDRPVAENRSNESNSTVNTTINTKNTSTGVKTILKNITGKNRTCNSDDSRFLSKDFINVLTISNLSICENSTYTIVDGKKNFKKFKKVGPLHQKNRIVPQLIFKKTVV